jgi:hypothetical protein
MNKIIAFLIFLPMLLACSDKKAYKLSAYQKEYDGLLDTLMPFLTGMRDSLPVQQTQNREKLMQHKLEREYEWMHYAEKGDYAYFMVSRLEPSIKKDKYAAVCGRFRKDGRGSVDLTSYEELFWTWKMKKDSLQPKADHLFSTVVETGSIEAYMPEKSEGFWIEFPSRHVYYDKQAKSWKTRASY